MPRPLSLSPDFEDIIICLNDHAVRYVLVGGYAMAAHGYVRATGDIDIFIEPTMENAQKVYAALAAFGAPLHTVTLEDFAVEGTIYQMGLPPLRIDIINRIDGVSFARAIESAQTTTTGANDVKILSLNHLIENKLATGRDKDRIDANELAKIMGTGHE